MKKFSVKGVVDPPSTPGVEEKGRLPRRYWVARVSV